MRDVVIGLAMPFIGTTLGSLMVFFLRKEMSIVVDKVLLGFASGVMIAASVWSLLIPSIEMSANSAGPVWVPAALGFIIGILVLLLLDHAIPHLHAMENNPEGPESNLSKRSMLVLAVTLHNIPEGMAVGVVFAGVIYGIEGVTIAGALVLSLGIAIQNFPEGAIVAMPLLKENGSKTKSFIAGALSGIVEPIAAIITILFVSQIEAVLPYLLAGAAGAMIYVVEEELIPEGQTGNHTDINTIALGVGFVVMMVLDVALG